MRHRHLRAAIVRPAAATWLLPLLAPALAACGPSPAGEVDAEPAAMAQTALPPPPLDCSTQDCAPADQHLLLGQPMFDEDDFTTVIHDGFGRARRFYVHIPDDYDAVDGTTEKIPLVFAFHGGGDQTPEAMITGKWEAYFDDDIAFAVPVGEADPCDDLNGNGKSHWMQVGMANRNSPNDPNCDPASAVVNGAGDTVTYWNASLPGSFADVLFVEELRAMLLDRFPKLNAQKVYATGFSSGGGMTNMLACYRSPLFRGFTVVSKMLAGDSERGDFDDDGVLETDPRSLTATCGRSELDPGRATGIATPRVWGMGLVPGPFNPVLVTNRKPFGLFVGDQEREMLEINDTSAFVRDRNNLTSAYVAQNPFHDVAVDAATTQRRTYTTAANGFSAATFRRWLVQGAAGTSGTHAMPDADECGAGDYFMTCDYDYTTQTKLFFQDHADLGLAP